MQCTKVIFRKHRWCHSLWSFPLLNIKYSRISLACYSQTSPIWLSFLPLVLISSDSSSFILQAHWSPCIPKCAGISCTPDFVSAFPSLRVFLQALPIEGLPSLLDPTKHWGCGLYCFLSPWGTLKEILPQTEKMLNKPQLLWLSCLFYKAVPSSLSERLSCPPGLSVFWGHLVIQLFMNKSVLIVDHECPSPGARILLLVSE